MTRSEFIAKRLREVYLNGRWIANTNFKAQIENLNREQATRKIDDLNTIAALTFHVNYYLDGLLNLLKSGKLEISDKYSFDMPPINSEEDWKGLADSLFRNAEEFASHLEGFPDSKWDEVFVNEKYGTWWRNIEGVIEHGYYHLGQVSLIRKMVLAKESE